MARPTKYKEEYCEMLYEHMKQGLSFESFGGVIRVVKDTLYQWVKRYDEFSYAKREGETASLLFWEKIGIQGMFMGGKDNPFNASTWIFNMKNRHGWRDKQETEIKADKETINIVYTKNNGKVESDPRS